MQEQNKYLLSRNLLRFAWLIEVFAVGIGFFISLIIGYDAFHQFESTGNYQEHEIWSQVIIATLPFMVVAIMELTKIPMTQAFYRTRNYWLLIALIIVGFITFETLLNGFERNFMGVTQVVDHDRRELEKLQEDKRTVESKLEGVSPEKREQINKEFNDQLAILRAKLESELETANAEILKARGSLNNSHIQSIEEELETLRITIKDEKDSFERQQQLLMQQLDKKFAKSDSNMQMKQENLRAAIKAYEVEIAKLYEKKEQAVNEANLFTKSGVEEDWDNKIQKKELEKKNKTEELLALNTSDLDIAARDKFDNSINELKRVYSKRNSDLIEKRNALLQRISRMKVKQSIGVQDQVKVQEQRKAEAQKNYSDAVSELEKDHSQRKTDSKNDKDERSVYLKEKTDIEEKIAVVKSRINKEVGKVQFYRLAQNIYGKESAADLTRDEVYLIAVIWFTSLAFIIAFMGVFLAYTSELMRDHESGKNKPSSKLISRFIAGLFKRNRKKLYKEIPVEVEKEIIKEVPVEVEKEVIKEVQVEVEKEITREVPVEVIREIPVEKVVFKEVPVEIIKKELVHVPVYTNDKELLNQGEK